MSPTDRPKPPNVGPPPDAPDPDDPPSEEEIRAADALQRVLDGKRGPREGVDSAAHREAERAGEWAQSLRAATSPREISSERHQQLIDRALATSPKATSRPRTGKVAYVAFGGVAGLLAMAAAVALVVRGTAPERAMSAKATAERAGATLALSRSTAELFPEGIPRSGGTSDRVDRIAYARAQDYRQNRFARWGAP